MSESAEVVIVGGGVIGASVAYHLARGGCTDVLVLDAAPRPGEGSTGRATGGFRAQFGSAPNIRLSLLSRDALRRFAGDTGVDPGYQPVGYLFIARHAAELEVLLQAQALQHAEGLHEARRVDADEARALNPAIRGEIAGGTFCPTDGYIRPLEILRGYTEAARRLGVRFAFGRACTGFRMEGDSVRAVRTAEGEIGAGCVVNAAGAWAARVAEMAGVRIPVRPLRRQVALTAPCGLLPADMPMTIFCDDGFHLRVRDGRVLLLWPDEPAEADPYAAAVQDGWVDEVVRRARERLPCLRDAVIDRAGCWAGLYEMSPDHHVLLGSSPEVPNLYLANGSSGHGVMHAPAIGLLLSEIILHGAARSMDVHPLRPGRFAEGEPVAGSALL
ncbi:MAG TPA: FAD-dependent oxidoreductase [Longimicrobium sp.]|nr:FAD-dependent oxidoreductase [Longimicrobium sp.]